MHSVRLLVAVATALLVALPLAGRSGLPVDGGAAASTGATAHAAPRVGVRHADFGGTQPSGDARHIADWIADSADNGALDFVVVDKRAATVYVFGSDASLRASSPVLLGSALGDTSAPGIGERPLSQVLPAERTTPAGRFMGERGRNARDEDVVWVDYDAAVSMHRVLTTNPAERRLERLATPSVEDNRISFGCINVPVAFYEMHIRPLFAKTRAFIYVLPDELTPQQVFGSYNVPAPANGRLASALP
ncbi:MAG: hypothetical protein LH632_10065 [Rhodoferax sp.]|nr:hypothetical protein [Rhodoferax sp.]